MEDINITIEETVVPISIIIDESPIGQTGPVGPTGLTGTTPLLSAIGDSIDVSYDNGSTFEELVKFASLSSGGGSEIYQSDTAPDPDVYPSWLNTLNNSLYLWYESGNTWVNVSHEQSEAVPVLATFAAVGDSNTDRTTNVLYPTAQNTICYDQRAWGAILEQICNRQIVSVGPTAANTYKVGTLFDRDHGYSGITAHKMVNGDAVYGSLIPINDAIAADPDFYIVSIGTNDVSDQDAATTIARIRAVWAPLVATGKPVIGTDLLQRASAHNTEEIRDRIIAVNAGLRAVWQADGLWSYRQWDDLVVKDAITGFADSSEYPDNFQPSAPPKGPDGIHYGANLSLKLANDLKGFLSTYYNGVAPTIPADGHPSWITPNPYVSGGTTLATSWTNQFLDAGGAVTFSKVTDSEGTWQRVNITTQRTFRGGFQSEGIYSRMTGAGVAALIGTQCRPTARIRIPAGQNLQPIGISVQCVGAANIWTYHASSAWPYTNVPISEFDATIYCDPFTVPANTTQIWFLINPGSGTGIFDFQKAGIITV